MIIPLFFCSPLRYNLFPKILTHLRFSFSILADTTVNNSNAPSENLFVHFVTTRFNISSTDAAKMLKFKPSLGRLKTLENVEELVNVLNRHGCTDDQIATIIKSQPSQIVRSPERLLESRFQVLKDFGMDKETIIKILTVRQRIFCSKLENIRSNLELLETVFPSQDILNRAILRRPDLIVKSSLQKSLKASVAFWEDFGFRGIELTTFLKLDLWSLTHSSLTPEQLDLINKIGVHKENKKYKHVVGVVPNNRLEVLKARIDNLQLCGLSSEEAWELVS